MSQPQTGGTDMPVTVGGTGWAYTLPLGQPAPPAVRIQIQAAGGMFWCAKTTGASGTIPWGDFKTECWGTLGMAYDGVVPIEAIQVAVPGAVAGAQTFDFCVLDIEPGS